MFKIFENKKFLILLALINFIAGFYSITYYFWQLEKTSPLFWIFIIDCPLYAILFGINLVLVAKNKPSPIIGLASIVGNLKYGLWTLTALILPGIILSFPTLFLGHVLLIIEIIVLYKVFSFKIKHFIIVLVWFFFNDVLDYFVGIHPYFEPQLFNELMWFSFLSTLVLSFLIATFFSKK